jgi:hypothetical protein
VAPISVILEHMNFHYELAQQNRPTIKELNAKQAASDSFDPDLAKKIHELSVPGEKAVAAAINAAPFCRVRLAALAVIEPTHKIPISEATEENGF